MIRILAIAVAWLAVLASPGEARTRAECDRIENPMAFNECLASLTPEQQPRVRRGGRGGEEAATRRGGRRALRQTRRDEGPVKAVGGGRKRIEFTVR